MTEAGGPAWRQSTFYPIAETITATRGAHSLVTRVDGGELSTARHGDVPAVAATASLHRDTGAVTVLLTNRADTEVEATIEHARFGRWADTQSRSIVDDDSGPLHGAEAAAAARPSEREQPKTDDGVTHLTLPPRSWTVVTADTGAVA
jgi:alpha-N-arabinofuranosidase